MNHPDPDPAPRDAASSAAAAALETEIVLEPEDLLGTPAAGSAAVRGGALRAAAFLVSSAVGVLTAALLFRHLGVADTGKYTLAIVLSAVVTGLTDLGLTAVGIRELTVLHATERALFSRNLLGLRLLLTTVGVIGITIFAFIVYGHLQALAVLIAGIGVIVQNVQGTLQVPLMARLRLGWVSLLEIGRQLVGSAMILVLIVVGAGLLPFLATIGLAAACALIPTVALVRGDVPLVPSFDFAAWRALIRPVLTYSIAVAAGTLYFRIALVLVSVLTDSHQVGYFSVSYRIVEVLFTIPGLVVTAAFPIFARAARDDPDRLAYAISRVFEVLLIVGVWVALALAVGATFAIKVIGGPKFAPAAEVLAVQGVAAGATFVSAVWGFAMLSLHLHRLILIFNLSMLVLVAAAVAALAPLDGAQGAAIGIAAAEVVGAIGAGVLLVRGRTHLKPRLRVLPRVALAALLAASPVLVPGLGSLGRVLVGTVIYAVVLLALKAPPQELYDVLPARMRRIA